MLNLAKEVTPMHVPHNPPLLNTAQIAAIDEIAKTAPPIPGRPVTINWRDEIARVRAEQNAERQRKGLKPLPPLTPSAGHSYTYNWPSNSPLPKSAPAQDAKHFNWPLPAGSP